MSRKRPRPPWTWRLSRRVLYSSISVVEKVGTRRLPCSFYDRILKVRNVWTDSSVCDRKTIRHTRPFPKGLDRRDHWSGKGALYLILQRENPEGQTGGRVGFGWASVDPEITVCVIFVVSLSDHYNLRLWGNRTGMSLPFIWCVGSLSPLNDSSSGTLSLYVYTFHSCLSPISLDWVSTCLGPSSVKPGTHEDRGVFSVDTGPFLISGGIPIGWSVWCVVVSTCLWLILRFRCRSLTTPVKDPSTRKPSRPKINSTLGL